MDTVSERHLLTSTTVNNWGGRHFACVLHTTLIDDVINLAGYERTLDIIETSSCYLIEQQPVLAGVQAHGAVLTLVEPVAGVRVRVHLQSTHSLDILALVTTG